MALVKKLGEKEAQKRKQKRLKRRKNEDRKF